MGYVARAIESTGIPTVCVYVEAFRANAEIIKPPRVLLTPYPMGRPIGFPGHREGQRAVVKAALRLLETAGRVPVIETFTA